MRLGITLLTPHFQQSHVLEAVNTCHNVQEVTCSYVMDLERICLHLLCI